MSGQDRATVLFTTKYNQSPSQLVRAPARVNLIGEHTDYNDGFVLPMAINREMWIAFHPRDDRIVRVRSESFVDEVTFDLDQLTKTSGWGEYVKGVAWSLQDQGLMGWDGVIASDIPMGAGLSSSAALGIATAAVFSATSSIRLEQTALAKLVQRAENEWVGVSCGIMDQLVIAGGTAGNAQLIDCRSLATVDAPLPFGAVAVVLDTGTRRGHVDSAYNARRAQCAAVARRLSVAALRDVTLSDLMAASHDLADESFRRARHVVTENQRTLEAAAALRATDLQTVGKLMTESHLSLRDDFEVSSRPLDAIVEAAEGSPGCFGARMMGGGFGGCAVALVQRDAAAQFEEQACEAYTDLTGLSAHAYVTEAVDGVSTATVA